ncbi:hypothetical protein S83_011286 [Arachis hypogaea]|nr:Cysteine proteinase inhibitor [Arachis hypogaea]
MHSPTKNHKTQHKFKSLGYQKRLPAMRNNGYYLIFVLVALLSTCLSGMAASLGGHWTALKDVNNYPHVTELTEFAVTEYNKQSEKNLKLVKLVKGDMQVVASTTASCWRPKMNMDPVIMRLLCGRRHGIISRVSLPSHLFLNIK